MLNFLFNYRSICAKIDIGEKMEVLKMKYPVTASRLSEAMKMRDIIAQELADKTGIHKSSISQYVNGSHTPSIKNAGKMAAVLNVAPAWLKGYDVPNLHGLKEKARDGIRTRHKCRKTPVFMRILFERAQK